MGILRSIGKSVFGVIFALSLTGMIVTIGLVQVTEYENMKTVFSEIVSTQIESGQTAETNSTQIQEAFQELLRMCEGKDSVQLPIPQGEPITIDCNKVRESQTGEQSIGQVIGDVAMQSMFDSIYYSKYDCDFVTCLQTGRIGIILSEQGHVFLQQLQLYLIIAVAASGVLIVVIAENWPDRLKGIGWPMTSTGLSYIILGFGRGIIVSMLPIEQQAGVDMMSIVDRLVEPMMNNFLIVLVVGIVLTACGYALAYKAKKKNQKEAPKKK